MYINVLFDLQTLCVSNTLFIILQLLELLINGRRSTLKKRERMCRRNVTRITPLKGINMKLLCDNIFCDQSLFSTYLDKTKLTCLWNIDKPFIQNFTSGSLESGVAVVWRGGA